MEFPQRLELQEKQWEVPVGRVGTRTHFFIIRKLGVNAEFTN